MWKVIIWPNNILPSWKLLKLIREFFFFFPLLIRIIKSNVFLYTPCRGEIYKSTVGFGPRVESSHDKKGKRGQKVSSPILLG